MVPIESALPWPVVNCHNLMFRFWDAFIGGYITSILYKYFNYFKNIRILYKYYKNYKYSLPKFVQA